MNAVNKLKEGLSAIDGLEIIGNPQAILMSYRSIKPQLNIFAVGDVMEQKGWLIDRIQRPDALHAMVTASHDKVIEQYLRDLKDSVATVLEHPELGETGQAATYVMISHIPLRGMVKKQVADMFANSYKLNAKEIDLSDSENLASGADTEENSPDKMGIVQKLINWYVKKQMSKKG